MNSFSKITFYKIVTILLSPFRRKSGWFALSSLAIILSAALCSCLENTGVEYSSFIDIAPGGIAEERQFDFSPEPADSGAFGKTDYDLIIVVRYIASTKSKEVKFDIEEFSLQQDTPDSTSVTIPLFDKEDEPTGTGIYSIYETSDTLRRKMKVPLGYTVTLSSPLSAEETDGIRAIGVVLSRSGGPYKNLFKLWN